MKTYYICSDTHSYFNEFKSALEAAGFDAENKDDILVIIGDMLDRGPGAKEIMDYVLKLPVTRFFYIIGNHDTLLLELLQSLKNRDTIHSAHKSNGTLNTVSQFTGISETDLLMGIYNYEKDIEDNKYIKKFKKLFIERAVNFLETDHYIFTHGYIPIKKGMKGGKEVYLYNPEWREVEADWEEAHWLNGMEVCHSGVKEKGKTIVCGHFHSSWGHSHINQDRKEFPPKSSKEFKKSFEPYYEKGIIAIDGCTAYSGIVNILKLKENELWELNA